ncbi:alpha/beta hydrolase family protein [Anaerobacillus arseniciselenatis]|uniref:alpha/beta hydrolase family protein n=1 Tax=Anaerobacillus arseniciselenatis TaxID=85682 RepID=UPI001FDF66CD|nr:prolyl oligopeptidase family serine peptidase [Anaerobacillus arseniciselenatis]
MKINGYLALPNDLKVSLQHLRSYFPESVEQVAYSIIPQTKTLDNMKLPGFIYCRGGIGRFGRVKMHWIEHFASFGYVVFAPCYRGNEGSEGRDEFGGRDQEDVFSAYRIMENLPFVDNGRISVMGFSRGSINATQTAINMPNIHKLILWSGVSDLGKTYEDRIDLRRMFKRVIGGTPTKFPELYEVRSPIHMVEKIQCPTLVIHGTKDEQVLVTHGENMIKKLKHYDKKATYHRYDGYGHHFPINVHSQAVKKMFQWIESN